MRIKIIQWNISYSCKIDEICEYIKSHIEGKTIVCLQEVLPNSLKQIIDSLQPTDFSYSLNYRKPGIFDGKNRMMGVLTLLFGGRILYAEVLNRSVFPDRTLFSKAIFDNKHISLLNFHSLTGVSYKKAKGSNFASIAEFLYLHKDLDFFCCDSNEPKSDSFNIDNLEFWDQKVNGKGASLIFGKTKVHNLSDPVKSSLLLFSELPASYYTGKTSRRYDYIFVSDRWETESFNFYYEESIKASSDHAMVAGIFNEKSN